MTNQWHSTCSRQIKDNICSILIWFFAKSAPHGCFNFVIFRSERSEFKSTPRKPTEEPLKTRYWGAFSWLRSFGRTKEWPGLGAAPHLQINFLDHCCPRAKKTMPFPTPGCVNEISFSWHDIIYSLPRSTTDVADNKKIEPVHMGILKYV